MTRYLAPCRNGHDLYVTRATHRLTVVYEGELPPSLGASGLLTDLTDLTTPSAPPV